MSGVRLAPDPTLIRMAIMAMGGQGGGVLVDWIVALAERAGWTAQATSVAGVAQRTGATIYYLELAEPTPGREPVLALMPVPGEVDVVIAAELMEAGRAVERGLVTPQKTLLIASSHRAYATVEKTAPGNGVANSAAVMDLVRQHSQRCVMHDFQSQSVAKGSVISASLLGALCGSGALPAGVFGAQDFEAVVRASGVGVQASLEVLREAAQIARDGLAGTRPPVQALSPQQDMETPPRPLPQRPASGHPQMQRLLDRIRQHFPAPAHDWLGEGLARVCDWQDMDWGTHYLDRVAALAALDSGADRHALTCEAARWVAVAMSYDDVIRVAAIKTRAERSVRLRQEVRASAADVFDAEEYFHPGMGEILGLMPEAWARALEQRPGWHRTLERLLARGWRINSQGVRGHLMLGAVAQLRRWRLSSRRHATEMAHLERWLDTVRALAGRDLALATEALRCRRLVKGYSDTHARGHDRFGQLMAAANALVGRDDAAKVLAQLRDAALHDASGQALQAEQQRLGLIPHPIPSSGPGP